MRSLIRLAAIVLALGLGQARVSLAQSTIIGWIDEPVVKAEIPRSVPIRAGGWVFECESGLQPFTQQLGSFSVAFKRPDGTWWFPSSYSLYGFVPRDDVKAAYLPSCPHVGRYVGWNVTTDAPTEPGAWTLYVGFAVWRDGQTYSQSFTRVIVVS